MMTENIKKRTDTMIMRRDRMVIGVMAGTIMMIVIGLRKINMREDVKMSGDVIRNHMINRGDGMTIISKKVAGIKIFDELLGLSESNYLGLMALTQMDGFIEQTCSSKLDAMRDMIDCG